MAVLIILFHLCFLFFGNTFHSEIDVIDANALAVAAESADQSASPTISVIPTTNGKCKITIDTTAALQLSDWADHKLAPLLAAWFPKIVALLPSLGFAMPTHYTITVKDMDGVAYTAGTHVSVSEEWIQSQMNGQAIGSLVHETVHVVQQCRWGRPNNPDATSSPGWLVEWMADYVRWFLYEPQSHGADVVWMRKLRDFTAHYDDNYRVTANFLNWVTETYDPRIVTQLNAAMREGKYNDDLWKQFTGKTVQELGQEWENQIEANRLPDRFPTMCQRKSPDSADETLRRTFEPPSNAQPVRPTNKSDEPNRTLRYQTI